MSNKPQSTATAPVTGGTTTIKGANTPAVPTMIASGATLDDIKKRARQEFNILLKAETERGALWRDVLFNFVRVKEDWQAYVRELSLAIAEHFKAIDEARNGLEPGKGFDFTKPAKTWPDWAASEYESRFQNQVMQVSRVQRAIESKGVQFVRDVFDGLYLRLDDDNNYKKLEGKPVTLPALQDAIKNLPRDKRGRRSAAPVVTVPQKATTEQAVQGMASAEFAPSDAPAAAEHAKQALAEAAKKQSATLLFKMVGDCPEEFIPGLLSEVSTMLSKQLAPEFLNLSVEIGKALAAYRDRKAGKPVKAPAPKAEKPVKVPAKGKKAA